MSGWAYESGSGKSSHPGCDEYVVETDEDYVTREGEVRKLTVWDCPIHDEVQQDESYPIFDDDDRKFIWDAFLAAKAAGVVPKDMQRPANQGL